MTAATSEIPRPATRASRRWLRGIGTLGLAALFTAGIVLMMMALAGYFDRKVKPSPVETPDQPAALAATITL